MKNIKYPIIGILMILSFIIGLSVGSNTFSDEKIPNYSDEYKILKLTHEVQYWKRISDENMKRFIKIGRKHDSLYYKLYKVKYNFIFNLPQSKVDTIMGEKWIEVKNRIK